MPICKDAEHDKIYSRINSLESKIDSTNGYLKGVVESNEKLITLLEKRDKNTGRIVWALIVLLLFTICVIAFGAIGKEGMFTVRDTVPKVAVYPPDHSLDKWRYRG
jgi:hypothetical protein